jgi:putative membrane-bound dehydrogenase-like protein
MLLATLFLMFLVGRPWAGPADSAKKPAPGPRPPRESLRTLVVPKGFAVELVVAEPLVQSPIAFDWGPDGKLWVVEMGDYPLGLDNKGKPGGRIRCLESTKSDGRYDKSTIFLDNLSYPTGVMAWRKGVLVTCAPNIFYAEDTDGDGRADLRKVLFTGFGEVNPQHRVNGLRWGLDNWIYCANGDFAQVRDRPSPGGKKTGPEASGKGTPFTKEEDVRRLVYSGAAIKSLKTGAVVDIRNRDFRFRPDEGRLDPETGQSQYGRDRDDWGNWFGCNNAIPMWHFVLTDHYLSRNPHVAGPNPRVNAPPALTYPSGKIGRDTGTVRNPQGNAFTSACGITVYRDDLFGPPFRNSWFICEPVHNLVHREVMSPQGASFTSRRPDGEEKSEFLSSGDPWFSPTMVRTGPDGALWVADMYRKVLEHPNWLPAGWEKRVNVRAGHTRGRIYRIYPANGKPRPIPRLDRLKTTGLVAALDSPNGWQRDIAQQLLVQKKDRAAIPLLEKQAGHSPRAQCRLHALCTLDGLAALKPATLERALGDRHPGVRRHAVRLCESLLGTSTGLGTALAKLVSDPDAQVRLQLAYSLGAWDDPYAGRILGKLLLKEAQDPYISAAALSSLTKNSLPAAVEAVLALGKNRPRQLIENLLRSATGFGSRKATRDLLQVLATPKNGRYAAWQYAALAGWLDDLDQRNSGLVQVEKEGGKKLKTILKRLGKVFDSARQVVANSGAANGERLLAVRLLGRGPDRQTEDLKVLGSLLVPQTATDLQAAVMDSLGKSRDPQVAKTLLGGWQGYGPALRSRALGVLFQRDQWQKIMLDALERRQILPSEFDAARRERLLQHKSASVRRRAANVFAGLINKDRQKVVRTYQSALTLKGNTKRGRQLFSKTCAVCHRLGGIGHQVGPDLAMVRDKPPEWFLPALFDPNQAAEARYIGYYAVTKSGLTFTGILSNESGNSITLLGQEGKTRVILRSNLEELTSTGKSAMPEGLEKDLKSQDVADLIAFIIAGGPKE